jgi:ABC-type tungstate transport system permease subunit
MKKLIEHSGFTVARAKVQANRLIALAAVDPSQEAARDAKNAQKLLESIKRLGL